MMTIAFNVQNPGSYTAVILLPRLMHGLDWIGLDWIGLDWIGLDWIGLDWIGSGERVFCLDDPVGVATPVPVLFGFNYRRD
jgi:hypothetical protein